jgi:hypothetical protein
LKRREEKQNNYPENLLKWKIKYVCQIFDARRKMFSIKCSSLISTLFT